MENMETPKILELIARGGHGKDTTLAMLIKILEQNFKLEKEYMAYYMKDFIRKIFELEKVEKIDGGFKKNNGKWYDKNKEFISTDALDVLKDIDKSYKHEGFDFESPHTMREILQKVGTEFFRDIIDNDFHVKVLLNKIFKKEDKNVLNVFTDIRFDNEKEVFSAIGNKENINDLKKLSNSLHVNSSINELYEKFLSIVLNIDKSKVSSKLEKNIKKELSKVKQLDCNNNNYLQLKDIDLDLEESKTETKILRIFRVINDKDIKEQKELYKEHGLNFDKERDIVGYLREGIKPNHPSESTLALTKPYYEYKDDELIYANSLEELEKKLNNWVKNNFEIKKNQDLNLEN